MSALDETRQAIHEALAPLLPAGRVHLYPPPQLVAPCIWIDQPDGTVDDNHIMSADFPIKLVADGTPDAQCRILDKLLPAAWDVLVSGGFTPLDWRADYVDTGTPGVEQLHCYVIAVRSMLAIFAFCDPAPVTVPVWPEPVAP